MSSAAKRSRDSEDRLDLLFHALSDQTRRALLARLSRGTASITELAEPFRMSLPAVSKHVRILERACLVQRTIDGRVHRCSLDTEPLHELEQWIGHYRAFWQGQLDALADYVEKDRK
jgi:DNA-binding transcriptional ArsR family regulator